MLILTRKIGETIIIGDEIKVQVIEIKGRQVRLGIEAPNEFSVHREEIYLRIQEQNLKSLALNAEDIQAVAKLWTQIQGQDK